MLPCPKCKRMAAFIEGRKGMVKIVCPDCGQSTAKIVEKPDGDIRMLVSGKGFDVFSMTPDSVTGLRERMSSEPLTVDRAWEFMDEIYALRDLAARMKVDNYVLYGCAADAEKVVVDSGREDLKEQYVSDAMAAMRPVNSDEDRLALMKELIPYAEDVGSLMTVALMSTAATLAARSGDTDWAMQTVEKADNVSEALSAENPMVGASARTHVSDTRYEIHRARDEKEDAARWLLESLRSRADFVVDYSDAMPYVDRVIDAVYRCYSAMGRTGDLDTEIEAIAAAVGTRDEKAAAAIRLLMKVEAIEDGEAFDYEQIRNYKEKMDHDDPMAALIAFHAELAMMPEGTDGMLISSYIAQLARLIRMAPPSRAVADYYIDRFSKELEAVQMKGDLLRLLDEIQGIKHEQS